ncbi:MAG: hypothetical protein HY319_30810 [Armatimonadetes bacterium]|nr:hypothetical protein [Armatimonadota bacterium]
MSNHCQGILLLANPRPELLAGLPPEVDYRLWRYRGMPRVWVLEAWDSEHASPLPLGGFFGGFPPSSHPVGKRLEELGSALGQAGGVGAGWLAFACRVAQLLGQPAFAFMGDQSRHDFACNVVGARVEQLAVLLGDLEIRYERHRFKLVPVLHREGNASWSNELLARVESWPDVEVGEVHEARGSRRWYRHILELWPQAAGDPAEVIGIGYWDGASRFLDRFEVVTERSKDGPREDYRHMLVRVPEEIRTLLEAVTDRLFFDDRAGAARALLEAAAICQRSDLPGHATALRQRARELDPGAAADGGPDEPLPPWAATFFSLLFHPMPGLSANSYDLTAKEFVPAAKLLEEARKEGHG